MYERGESLLVRAWRAGRVTKAENSKTAKQQALENRIDDGRQVETLSVSGPTMNGNGRC